MPIRAALLLLPSLLAQGLATLRWTPKEGDEMTYRTTGTMTVNGLEATIVAVNTHKVIRVDPDGGYLIEAKPIQNKVTFGGQEIVGQGITTQTTYAANGEITEIRGDKADATGYRMANLTDFHAPAKAVAVGDAWTSEGRADPKTGAVAWKADYKVTGEETIGVNAVLKIDVTARETEGSEGGKAAGSVWVRRDGLLVQSKLTWTNVSVPGAPGPVNGTINLSLDGFKPKDPVPASP